MTRALRHTLDVLAIAGGVFLFATTAWLILAAPFFVQPDRVSSVAVAVRGAP